MGASKFQSTRPLRGTTRDGARHLAGLSISIHVPRTGHDKAAFADISPKTANFNPRAPYGARRTRRDSRRHRRDFNPRAPYGARPPPAYNLPVASPFQSTRPVRGATPTRSAASFSGRVFQSTCPVRGTTVDGFFNSGAIHISIHVPRTGHDRADTKALCEWFDFNPRAPYGARRPCGGRRRCRSRFQSTCPVRGTTTPCTTQAVHNRDFNPRAPYGARRGVSG